MISIRFKWSSWSSSRSWLATYSRFCLHSRSSCFCICYSKRSSCFLALLSCILFAFSYLSLCASMLATGFFFPRCCSLLYHFCVNSSWSFYCFSLRQTCLSAILSECSCALNMVSCKFYCFASILFKYWSSFDLILCSIIRSSAWQKD